MIRLQRLLIHLTRRPHHSILTSLPSLRKRNNIPNTLLSQHNCNQPIKSQRQPGMWRTPSPKRIKQVFKICQPLRSHLQDITEDEFLHSCVVDTTTSSTEFDAVDDEVVVV